MNLVTTRMLNDMVHHAREIAVALKHTAFGAPIPHERRAVMSQHANSLRALIHSLEPALDAVERLESEAA